MDKSTILRAFNDHFSELAIETQKVFPENEDLQTLVTFVSTIRKANPRILVGVWKECVADIYGDEIMNGNIEYFLSKDYTNDLGEAASNEYVTQGIDRIRAPIREMGEANQTKAMKYIQNLTKLSRVYHN